MTHLFDVSALGLRTRISFESGTSEAFENRVRRAWEDALLPEGAEPDIEISVPLPGDEEAVLERLSVDVTLAALAARRGSMLMFHAAGVAAPDGRVVAFVGPSGRGKTTLTKTLAQTYGYVSDETIAVDDDLVVHPYRKPLSLVRAGQPKDQVAGSTLGLRALPQAPLRLAALVVLDRVDGEVEPRLERVPLVEVLADVVEQMSYLPELERPLQRLAELARSLGGLLRLTYAEASTVRPLLDALLKGAIADARARVVLPALPELGAPSGVSTARVKDAVDDGESVLVLADRTVRVLGGIGPEVWRGLVAGLPREQIRDAVVDRFGSPPQGSADALIDAAINDLVSSGLVAAGQERESQP